MVLQALTVSGYRSIRYLDVRLRRLNVLVGENGCGKTNLYRSLSLISEAARGRFARNVANEGGMESVLWAGKYSKNEKRRFTIEAKVSVPDGPLQELIEKRTKQRLAPDCTLKYEISCGFPTPGLSEFNFDPEIKSEQIFCMNRGEKIRLLERERFTATLRDVEGKKEQFPTVLSSESVLSELREPHRFPELAQLRQEFLSWRFYHDFRTDDDSPLRQPQVGSRTNVLDSSGVDLASALQTILEVGDAQALGQAVSDGLGGTLEIDRERQRLSVGLRMPGFMRTFAANELSEGTLQYLCLLAALLSPRPPSLLVFNEPETSLHPRLLAPLAKMLVHSSKSSQIFLTTHSQVLADLIQEETGVEPVRLSKRRGETHLWRPEDDNSEANDADDTGDVVEESAADESD